MNRLLIVSWFVVSFLGSRLPGGDSITIDGFYDDSHNLTVDSIGYTMATGKSRLSPFRGLGVIARDPAHGLREQYSCESRTRAASAREHLRAPVRWD